MNNDETEDGMGFSGLVPTLAEKNEEREIETLRKRLEAVEKDLEEQRIVNKELNNPIQNVCLAGRHGMKSYVELEDELTKAEKANGELVEALKFWSEIISEADHGRQKYGSGPNDIAHDDAHGQQDWTGYILDKGILSRHENGRDHRQLMVQIAGLAISAIQSFDRKEKQFWPNAVATAEALKGEG